MMSRLVKKISFLFNDERIVLEADPKGNFMFPLTKVVDGVLKTVDVPHHPRAVIEHEKIRNWDPCITLNNGQKYRVYQGGDSSYMMAEVRAILDIHSEHLDQLKKKEPKQTSFSEFSWFGDYDEDIF